MLIAIPSARRAGNTTSDKLFKQATMYVPAHELTAYAASVKNKLVAVPSDVRGITATRNWILANTTDKYVVFLDDDYNKAGFFKTTATKKKRIDIDDEYVWHAMFRRAFDITEGMGYKLFGYATIDDGQAFFATRPLLFRSYVLGTLMGVINDGSYLFNETFAVKEDYELMLRHITERGGVCAFRNAYIVCSHWDTQGGCHTTRTAAIENDAIERLVSKYPSLVRRDTQTNNKYALRLTL